MVNKIIQDELNEFLKNSSIEMRKINPKIILSAAVLRDHEKVSSNYLQDWVLWYENSWIDAIEVMSYTNSTKTL